MTDHPPASSSQPGSTGAAEQRRAEIDYLIDEADGQGQISSPDAEYRRAHEQVARVTADRAEARAALAEIARMIETEHTGEPAEPVYAVRALLAYSVEQAAHIRSLNATLERVRGCLLMGGQDGASRARFALAVLSEPASGVAASGRTSNETAAPVGGSGGSGQSAEVTEWLAGAPERDRAPAGPDDPEEIRARLADTSGERLRAGDVEAAEAAGETRAWAEVELEPDGSGERAEG